MLITSSSMFLPDALARLAGRAHIASTAPPAAAMSSADDRRCRLRRRTKLTGDRITVSKKKAADALHNTMVEAQI